MSALWALSFDCDNKKKICNEEQLGVVDLFVHLKNSEDERIRKVCKRALWTIRDELKSSRVDKYKKLGKLLPIFVLIFNILSILRYTEYILKEINFATFLY